MILISVSSSSRWVAKLCRSACSVTFFLIPAASAVSWNRRLNWRVGHRFAGFTAGKQPALLQRHARVPTRWAYLPPLSQQIEHLGRQHYVPILAALGLLDANNPLRLVDMVDLQPNHFAGTQAAPIAETECCAGLEARGNGQHATRLARAHHLRNLLGLADVIDLGGKIQPSQRHAKQEPHSSHDAVAIADAYARLGKMQLEPADVLHGRRFGSFEKLSEPLTAVNVAPLRLRTDRLQDGRGSASKVR